ncbi:uncharacterized protein E0L32_007412 [Thyridium curvatum]|uniref:Major facilitator superfamily (MFS) profile domain-containing protein n=1 Tax=Thyridium curvatum TaxID=1093900 RepID=A0A507AZP0_9PEZI|nr:uncharacterized protein E0L32_007412 [Thyridium curvatum]TPX11914.1 hypothetical protein E0L32_007412 [Thyridium curvatum]
MSSSVQSLVPQAHLSRPDDGDEIEMAGGLESRMEPLQRVVTAATTPTSENAEDEISTWKSVTIVISSFTIVFVCCGLNFAFGVYQALFEEYAEQPDNPFTGATPAQIDLIGTLGISFMTIGAPFAVAWAKLFSPRKVAFIGGLIFGLSLVLASFGTKLWHFQMTQGFLLGIGTCLSYMVAVTVAPTWFTSRRGLAMGIILSGTGVGGLVWAPSMTASVEHMGFRNTLRVSGAFSAVCVAAASMALGWEPATRRALEAERAARTSSRASGMLKVPLLDVRVARTRKFAAQALGAVLQSAAYYTPVFFFASYARTLGYGPAAGANFIAVSNACNAVGKIAIGHAADRVGRLNLLFLTTLMSAIVTVAFWLPSTLYPYDGGAGGGARGLFVAFTVFYGIFASAYVSLFPTSLVELFGTQNFASVNGVLYMVRGMATMIGTPVGGALIRSSAAGLGPKTYEGMSVLVSVLLFGAAVAVLWVRAEAMISHDGTRVWKWRL